MFIDDGGSGALRALVDAHPSNAVWRVTSRAPLAVYDSPSLRAAVSDDVVVPNARVVVAEASSLPLFAGDTAAGSFLWLANGRGWIVDRLPNGSRVAEREKRPAPLSKAIGFVHSARGDVTFLDNGQLSLDDSEHVTEIKLACPDPCEVWVVACERPLRIYDAPGLGSAATGVTVAPRARVVVSERRAWDFGWGRHADFLRLANGHGWIMDRLPDGTALVELERAADSEVAAVLNATEHDKQREVEARVAQDDANTLARAVLNANSQSLRDATWASLETCLDALDTDAVIGTAEVARRVRSGPLLVPRAAHSGATKFSAVAPASLLNLTTAATSTTSSSSQPTRRRRVSSAAPHGATAALLGILRTMKQAREWGAPRHGEVRLAGGLLIETGPPQSSHLEQREDAARAVSRVDMYERVLANLVAAGATHVTDRIVRIALGLDVEDQSIAVGSGGWSRSGTSRLDGAAAVVGATSPARQQEVSPLHALGQSEAVRGLQRSLHGMVKEERSGGDRSVDSGGRSALLREAAAFVQAGALLPASLSAKLAIEQLGNETTFSAVTAADAVSGGRQAGATTRSAALSASELKNELLGAARTPRSNTSPPRIKPAVAVEFSPGTVSTAQGASATSALGIDEAVRDLLELRSRDEAAAIATIQGLVERGGQ